MPLDGLRAWIGEVERKLGVRTRVFLVLAAIAIGVAGAAMYLAIDTRDTAVSESDVQALQEDLEGQIGAGGATGTAELAQLEAELNALEAEVARLQGKGGASNPDKGASGESAGAASEGIGTNGSGTGGIATDGEHQEPPLPDTLDAQTDGAE